MTDAGDQGIDADLPDAAVREMVADLRPDWSVGAVERVEHGTDFVALLDVRTPDGDRRVVLKATTSDLVDPPIARAEPRLLELVGRETSIPVPEVFGSRDEHDEYPAPFYLMEHVEGENYEGRIDELPSGARERVTRDAGANLAELHDLGPLPAYGTVGVVDGDLGVLDSPDHPQFEDYRDCLLDHAEEALDTFDSGGYFPDLADDPQRFADLEPALRSSLRETVPDLSDPDPPTYAHTDYRAGNLLLDPESGRTNAVIDWANLAAADPVYNLASAESLLLTHRDAEQRREELRRAFREAYAEARAGWSFDDAVRERLRVYHLVCRLHAMACLPLWYREATPEERDRREEEHRAFVAEYL